MRGCRARRELVEDDIADSPPGEQLLCLLEYG
jgi:hypothetical protein